MHGKENLVELMKCLVKHEHMSTEVWLEVTGVLFKLTRFLVNLNCCELWLIPWLRIMRILKLI